jgi:YD repeat-containing protein
MYSVERTYADGGVVVDQYEDYDGDAVFDGWGASTLDGTGQLDHIDHDAGVDGTVDARSDYTFVGDLPTRITTDAGVDGTIDGGSTFTYDADHNLVRIEYDYETDGTLDWSQDLFHFDDGGTPRVAERATDLGADGTTDERAYLTWIDAQLVQLLEDDDDDGVLDQTTTYTYDADGRQTLARTEHLGSGSIALEVRTTWTCP